MEQNRMERKEGAKEGREEGRKGKKKKKKKKKKQKNVPHLDPLPNFASPLLGLSDGCYYIFCSRCINH